MQHNSRCRTPIEPVAMIVADPPVHLPARDDVMTMIITSGSWLRPPAGG
jgi:hypothetical protein